MASTPTGDYLWYSVPNKDTKKIPAPPPGYIALSSADKSFYTFVPSTATTYPTPPPAGTKVGKYGIVTDSKGATVSNPTSTVTPPWQQSSSNTKTTTTTTRGSTTTTQPDLSSGALTMPAITALQNTGLITRAQATALQNLEIPTAATASSTGVYTINGTQLIGAIDSLTQSEIDAIPGLKGLKASTVQNAIKYAIGLDGPNLAPGNSASQRASTVASYLGGTGDLANIPSPSTMSALGKAQATITNLTGANSPINVALSSTTASQKYNVIANVDSTLESWGMNTPAMRNLVQSYASKGIINQNEMLAQIRATKAYNDAFPGLADYNKSTGAVHMSESQYMSYSQTIQNSATQYGAPMPTQAQIATLLNNHVSAAEYQQRVVDVATVVENANQNTRNILQQQYGIGQPELMHYMINGNLPSMQRQVAGAEIQDYATRVGLAGLKPQDASQLAEMARLSSTTGNQALGYGVSQIEQSLLAASKDVGLTKASPGATTPTVSTNQLIGSQLAGFAGTNQVAEQVQVARAEQAAAAPFEKGGGFVETAKGVTGLGSART